MKFHDHAISMMQCRCGDLFHASGLRADVARQEREWSARHRDCSEQQRDGVKVFWLSFCDNTRPKGQQFLGAAVVEVTAAEADEAALVALLRFPFAQPGAQWIGAAITKAHQSGCNPGGEVATMEIPAGHPMLAKYARGVLMDRVTVERIDRELELADRGGLTL